MSHVEVLKMVELPLMTSIRVTALLDFFFFEWQCYELCHHHHISPNMSYLTNPIPLSPAPFICCTLSTPSIHLTPSIYNTGYLVDV